MEHSRSLLSVVSATSASPSRHADMAEHKEYRRAKDFEDAASEEIFPILQTDLNGDDVERAHAARRFYEFISLQLAYTKKLEAKSDSRKAELLKVKGAVEFLSKRVIVVSPEKPPVQDEGEPVKGEDREAGP